MTYIACAIIPVYNHGTNIGVVVTRLRNFGLMCLLVDDGSDADCAAILDTLSSQDDVVLIRRKVNGGKGAAVKDGLRAAHAAGYTHALQIDADGQHALDDVPLFLNASRANPKVLICGAPTYGSDMPRARYFGRWLTHIWVWINTLSFEIRDAMCGFRLYPLDRVLPVLDEHQVGERMDFDIGVIVPMHWHGVSMQWITTPVIYPVDGVSHFKVWSDNLLISRMHTKLFFGMLRRAPSLIYRRHRSRGPG